MAVHHYNDLTIQGRRNIGNFFFQCSEVKTYNASMDFTLPSVPKKRKIEEVDKSADSTPKKIKQESEEEEGKKEEF